MKNIFKKGFTLVELIVVITILAILATIAFVSFSVFSKQSRNSSRASDVKTIERSLSIFSTKSNYYPDPENPNIVDYDGDTLFYQGTFGNKPYSEVGTISNIPKDPLNNTEYIYSVINNKSEYEILAIYEGEMVKNGILNNTYANNEYKPKIGGTYNKIYVKTENYYVPLPSIINSEISTGTTIDNSNIDSFVVTNGDNLPEWGDQIAVAENGNLDINLSVYTGSIDSNSINTEKENLVLKIQEAYTGSSLESIAIYSNILNKSTTNDRINFIDTVVLNNNVVSSSPQPTYSDCSFNGNTVNHGTNITAYETSSVTYGNSCNSETRNCYDGVLDGTFTFSNCTPDGATGTFNLSQTNVIAGTNITITNNCSEAPTSYTSSNTSLATISGNTITTLSAGSPNITPVGGACGDSNPKTITINGVDGVCGTAESTPTTIAPSTNLCSIGTPTSVTANSGTYSWNCNSTTGGSSDSCSTLRQYTVTFNGNGGSGHSPSSKDITYNNSVGTLPSDPTRSGYLFNGWFTASSGGTQINTSTNVTSNTNIYAQWTLSIYRCSSITGGDLCNDPEVKVSGNWYSIRFSDTSLHSFCQNVSGSNWACGANCPSCTGGTCNTPAVDEQVANGPSPNWTINTGWGTSYVKCENNITY